MTRQRRTRLVRQCSQALDGLLSRLRSSVGAHFSVHVFLLLLLLELVSVPCFAAQNPDNGLPAFFDTTNLWSVELSFSQEQWQEFLKGKRTTIQKSSPTDDAGSHPNYVYAHADFIMGGQMIHDVGVRLKGGGTQAGNGINRWPFRIDLGHFGGRSRLDGVRKISLNNNYYDSSYLRDVLSYEFFRNFDVPAPRTCFIKLHLTVPGIFQRKYLGLYTAVEALESPFLKDHFHNVSGLLLKPDFGMNSFPTGQDWPSLRGLLHPKRDGTAQQRQRVIDLFQLINWNDLALFEEGLPILIDVDEYLRFLVVNVVLVNQDSYLGMGKNYYVYLDPGSNRLNWLPWDLDLSMAGYFFCGTAAQRIHLSVDQPSSIADRLIRRVLAVPKFRERYHELMKKFLVTCFQRDRVFARIDELADIIREAVKEENSTSSAEFYYSIDGRTASAGAANIEPKRRWMLIEPGLKSFVAKRIESVEAQLAGKDGGLRTGFGPVQPWDLK